MLEIERLTAGYGEVPVLRDVSLTMGAGEIVGLLGANNAGKTTLINALSGLVTVMSGRILFAGEDVTRLSPRERVELGIVQVPEGRLVFPDMSVRENLCWAESMREPSRIVAARWKRCLSSSRA